MISWKEILGESGGEGAHHQSQRLPIADDDEKNGSNLQNWLVVVRQVVFVKGPGITKTSCVFVNIRVLTKTSWFSFSYLRFRQPIGRKM